MNYKKIAELAHVSASTVSKALSGSSEINQETAERIRQIAIDVGYFKEKTKRKREYANDGAYSIAVIVPEIMGFHYATIITCIQNQVERNGGYAAVYISDFNKEKTSDILKNIILHGATDGVIMFYPPTLSFKPNIPIVCCCEATDCGYDTIYCSQAAILKDSVKFLSNLGHRKIGFVGETHTVNTARLFEAAMKQYGLPFQEEYVYTIDARFEQIGHRAALQLLEQEEKPTAVIAAYDEVGIGLISTLAHHGIRVPEDLSVMGVNNIPSAAYAPIPLTSVETFSAEQYETAVDILFEKILTDNQSSKHICLEHKIIERETTKPAKGACNENK